MLIFQTSTLTKNPQIDKIMILFGGYVMYTFGEKCANKLCFSRRFSKGGIVAKSFQVSSLIWVLISKIKV